MDVAGDRSVTFRRLYQDHYSEIAAYARRRLDAQDAEDLVAETFLVVWRRIEDIPEGDLTRPWLYAVARRVLSQGRRSRGRWERLVNRLGGLRRTEEIAVMTEDLEDRDVVRHALARLRPQDQELLRLAEWEDLDHAELARVFGCSSNAIAIRLHRAHRRFSEALDAVDREAGPAPRVERTR
jgi:RNA polymerase sigma-70 factor (ECF subfamily)